MGGGAEVQDRTTHAAPALLAALCTGQESRLLGDRGTSGGEIHALLSKCRKHHYLRWGLQQSSLEPGGRGVWALLSCGPQLSVCSFFLSLLSSLVRHLVCPASVSSLYSEPKGAATLDGSPWEGLWGSLPQGQEACAEQLETVLGQELSSCEDVEKHPMQSAEEGAGDGAGSSPSAVWELEVPVGTLPSADSSGFSDAPPVAFRAQGVLAASLCLMR